MKILINGKIYVQKKDLDYIDMYDACIEGYIPKTIRDIVADDDFISSIQDQYDFVEFSSPKEIKFIKNCRYIADYDLLSKMDDGKLVEYMNQINMGRKRILKQYIKQHKKVYENYLHNDIYAKEFLVIRDLYYKIKLLEYKILSVRDYLWFKRGKLDLVLPEGLEEKPFDSFKVTKKELAIMNDLPNLSGDKIEDYVVIIGEALLEHRTGIKRHCSAYDSLGLCSISNCLDCENCYYKITLENGATIANSNVDLSTIKESGTGFIDDDHKIYFYDQVPGKDNLLNYIFSDKSNYRLVRTSDNRIMYDHLSKSKKLFL